MADNPTTPPEGGQPSQDDYQVMYDNPTSRGDGGKPAQGPAAKPEADPKPDAKVDVKPEPRPEDKPKPEDGKKPGEGREKPKDDDGKNKDEPPSPRQYQEAVTDAVKDVVPEGYEVMDSLAQSYAKMAQDMGLTVEQTRTLAQTYLEAEISEVRAREQERQTRAKEALTAHFKGDEAKAKEAAEHAKRGLEGLAKRADGVDAAAFLAKLEAVGLGNDLDMVKVFGLVGRAMAEHDFHSPSAPGAAMKTVEQTLYDNSPDLK
jgi:hypothetical protein